MDDFQFFPFGGETQYCQEEIPSVRGIDPRRAKYHVGGARIANRLFAGKFGSAVCVNWIWRICLDIGSLLRAVEDIVGREVNEYGTDLFRFHSKQSRCFGVDCERIGLVGFRCVNRSIGGRVDNQLGLCIPHDLANFFRLAQVQILPVRRDHFAQFGQQSIEFRT